MTASSNNFLPRIKDWLLGKGYPLEFYTANICKGYGLRVSQGEYVDCGADRYREIDVVADMDVEGSSDSLLRLSIIAECKYSKQKPWVVFTSPTTCMAPSACAAQAIGSDLALAVLYFCCGHEDLEKNKLFAMAQDGGFSGRQALASGNDLFYNTMQGICEKSVAHAQRMDRGNIKGSLPRYYSVSFPVVILDAPLFKASYDIDSDDVKLEEVSQIRCYWRGSDAWIGIIPIDIVTKGGLNDYIAMKVDAMLALSTIMHTTREQFQEAWHSGNAKNLTLYPGPRGIVGLTPLLQELKTRIDAASERTEAGT